MNFRANSPQRKKEILVVSSGFDGPENGAGHAAGELITAMSRRSPFRFTWTAQGSTQEAANLEAVLPGQSVIPMRGWGFMESMLGSSWPFWNRASLALLQQAIAAADCVWLHDTLYPGAKAAARLARALGKPLLVTQHSNPVFHGLERDFARRGWASLLDRLVTSPILRQARQVVFTSDAAARFYQRLPSFRSPARIIPNGIDAQVFHPPSADDYRGLRTRFALRDDQPVLLFVGKFQTASGVKVIRHLAQFLPKWRFWVAGYGRTRPESWYLPNVQVFRNRTAGALAELYQAADLLILPGCGMESPQVFQQALSSQLPVMCTPEAMAAYPGAPRCLVVPADARSAENTARHWAQKLKAGKDVWPVADDSAANMPFDFTWDWLQVAAHYTEILNEILEFSSYNAA